MANSTGAPTAQPAQPAKEAVISRGLQWALKEAQVLDVNSFQNDDGEPMAYVQLEYWGGTTTIMVDPEVATQFLKYKGKIVSAKGKLSVVVKTTGVTKVKFGLSQLHSTD